MKKTLLILLIGLLSLSACTGNNTNQEPTATQPALTEVTLMLDWVPNVNHTGIFVAQDQGYFTDSGLAVKIIQPGEVMAESAVASGSAQFGVSFQDQLTMLFARQHPPLVSIAAIIQHNTSGFASRADSNVTSPADWAGLNYGSFGSEFEEPTLRSLMECAGGDFSKLTITNVGFDDPLALLQQKQIDLGWIFYGTQGIAAKQQGIDLTTVMMSDHFDCIPDYYTPVLITSQDMIDKHPDTVRAFVSAVAKGYQYAIDHPHEAADILYKSAPESDLVVLFEQQAWLSPRYAADAPRWGEQSADVWLNYSKWMADQGIIDAPLDASKVFTNEFLP
jgi:ABC-type nitrate/sulfonate/bicarbonate transport system substrate-binding protein